MYCTRCGTQNPDDGMYCSNCSAPLAKPGEPLRQTAGQPRPAAPPASPQHPARNQEPYPGFQSSYSGAQGYQPYPSSYANQIPAQTGSPSGRAIASMILSIIAFFTCGPLLSIPGMILGKSEMNAINNGVASPAGLTFAKIGFYLGLAGTIIFCLLGAVWSLLVSIGSMTGSI